MEPDLADNDWDLLDPHLPDDPAQRVDMVGFAATALGVKDTHTLIAHHPTWSLRWESFRPTWDVRQALYAPIQFKAWGGRKQQAEAPPLAGYWHAHDLVTFRAQRSTTTPERDLVGPGVPVMRAFADTLGPDTSGSDQARAVVVAKATHACLIHLARQTNQELPAPDMTLEHIRAWWAATWRPHWERLVLLGGNPWAPLADVMDAWYLMVGLDAPWYAMAGYTLTEAHHAVSRADPSDRPTREALTLMAGLQDQQARPVMVVDDQVGALSRLLDSCAGTMTVPTPVMDWLPTVGGSGTPTPATQGGAVTQ